jgi:hypothetical protein
MVAVLGLNKNWDKEADYAIVSNFFYAINKQELTLKINHDNISVSIDKTSLDFTLLSPIKPFNISGDMPLPLSTNIKIFNLSLSN